MAAYMLNALYYMVKYIYFAVNHSIWLVSRSSRVCIALHSPLLLHLLFRNPEYRIMHHQGY